jgi:hypothetical protein
MGADTDARSDDRLVAALDRLAGIQKSILELNQEANQIRRHVKDFDLNVDALNLLAIARSRDEKRGGGKVLEDVVRYARQTGMRTGADGGENLSRITEETMSRNPVPPTMENTVEPEEERGFGGVLKLLSELVVAAAVTTGLFVLIH